MDDERVSILSVKKEFYPKAFYLFVIIWFILIYWLLRTYSPEENEKGINWSWLVRHVSLSIPIAYAFSHTIIEIGGFFMYAWEVWKENREKKKRKEQSTRERELRAVAEKARKEGYEQGKADALKGSK